MQGFQKMLEMMGIDPQKMLADAQALLQQFEDNRAAEMKALHAKLDSLDKAIKELNPNYVPEEFKAGELVVSEPEGLPQVANAETPDGGPVDMSTLEPSPQVEEDPNAGSELNHSQGV